MRCQDLGTALLGCGELFRDHDEVVGQTLSLANCSRGVFLPSLTPANQIADQGHQSNLRAPKMAKCQRGKSDEEMAKRLEEKTKHLSEVIHFSRSFTFLGGSTLEY